MIERINIPADRVRVLLSRRSYLEKESKARLDVTMDGEVIVDGDDALLIYRCLQVIKAIGRGFAPIKAERLFDDRFYLRIFDIRDFSGKSRNRSIELKGRIIGRNGKARRTIEESTDCYLSVYGHTVSIIGSYPAMESAERAAEMLLEGSEHSVVFSFLRKEKTRRIKEELMNKNEQ
jgi:ribosomal RNA assembly protein